MAQKEKKNLKPYFDKCEEIEDTLGKDLCEFNHEEYLFLCESVSYANPNTFKNFISQCSLYREYCYNKGYSVHMERITAKEINRCLENKEYDDYIKYDDYKEIIVHIENSMDCFLIMGQYEGLFKNFNIKNIYDLQTKDFIPIGDEYKIYIDNRECFVSKELYECACKSQNQKTLKGKRNDPLLGNGIVKYKHNKKKLDKVEFTVTDLNKRVKKVKEQFQLNKSVNFYLSGAIYYILQESKRQNITAMEYVKTKWDEFSKKYSFSNKSNFINGYKKYFEEASLISNEKIVEESVFELEAIKKRIELEPKKINFDKYKTIGYLGEQFIFEREKEKVKGYGLDGEKTVVWSAIDEGDGIGYDIKSYDKGGNEIYIEVKTTRGKENEAIYITENELRKSKKEKDRFYLYRVYEFDEEEICGKVAIRQGDLSDLCIQPICYRVDFK